MSYKYGQPSEDEIQTIHREMLKTFVEESPGLNGMVLIGIREGAGKTAVEVSSAAQRRDIFRCAAALLDATLHTADDATEAKQIAKLADILLQMAGDDPDEVDGLSSRGETNVELMATYENGQFRRVK